MGQALSPVVADMIAISAIVGEELAGDRTPVPSHLHRIAFDPAQCGGHPRLHGMRIRATDVLQLFGFLVDNQLPPALARLISSEFGVDATHVADIGLHEAIDAQLGADASETNSVLISQNDDFVRLFRDTPTARLIWVRVGNCRCRILPEVFRRVWPGIVERLDKQDWFIEVR